MDQRKREVKKGTDVKEEPEAGPPAPTAEGLRPIKAADPDVPLHGIPGFHHVEEAGDHVRMASMELDKDEKNRTATGSGEQPSNNHGSRFATPSGGEE